MYGALDVSTSGMIAQRTRLEVISANLANQSTVLDANGNINPYKRRMVMFAAGDPTASSAESRSFGVHVAQIDIDRTPAQPREWNPDSPLAFKSGPYAGYVAETNVNSTVEQVNALEAVRAYEANVMAAETTKQMVAASLRLLA